MGSISHVEHKPEDTFAEHARSTSTFAYAGRAALEGLPDHELGDEELAPRTAQRLIKDLMLGDARPQMNLARCGLRCSTGTDEAASSRRPTSLRRSN